MLKLRVEDVKDKTHIVIREQKTSKRTRILMNSMLREDIEKYIDGMNNTEYLFKSRKGQNKPITRVQAYRILSEAGKCLGMAEVGTHT
ncbi:tyrosine-type recombinase/integrase [Clostridium botulinum]|uniref:tyrosine-type recombinase/integrase n=1 Tax=Clostridium botulinum TaxID=1491 RepID=UPI00214964F3|nr:tyrosine-type recombinase/integrase [Clostridium botulinum]MCR1156639.1 hypothetical protein [Clostridium botulinum]